MRKFKEIMPAGHTKNGKSIAVLIVVETKLEELQNKEVIYHENSIQNCFISKCV